MKRFKETSLTADVAREFLHYEPKTGALIWRQRSIKWFMTKRSCSVWNARYAGTLAGSRGASRYVLVSVFKVNYFAHRLIWLMMTGEWPEGEIDHIDHDPSNNAWQNLRLVKSEDNQRNMSRSRVNTSGVTGVCWSTRAGKWVATIGNRHIGLFSDFNAAVAARKKAASVFGYHPNHGVPR